MGTYMALLCVFRVESRQLRAGYMETFATLLCMFIVERRQLRAGYTGTYITCPVCSR